MVGGAVLSADGRWVRQRVGTSSDHATHVSHCDTEGQSGGSRSPPLELFALRSAAYPGGMGVWLAVGSVACCVIVCDFGEK